jgi:UDP-N-acetylglucosamine 4,6-dehydratase/5-epimerase
MNQVEEQFEGKTLLITGGTGTFGTAVLNRFLNLPLKQIRIFSRDEKKQDDMRQAYNNPKLRFIIGDVRNLDSMTDAMQGVDYVFHAAALKQVPSCEFHPMEAIRTNAIGGENAMNAAVACGVKRMVVLSTDKAAYPINAMGMSKALMEKLMVAKARVAKERGTILCGTRYGNVMCSRGSVIPLFISQIERGEPLTVTDPRMTRFMMSIEDAVELVLFAFQHARPGDLFVEKAPATEIGVLAKAIKKVFNAENPVRVIGTRHGEKLYETLLTREEMARSEDMGHYYRVSADARDLNYKAFFEEGTPELSFADDYHSHNTQQLDVDETAELLLTLPYVQEARLRMTRQSKSPAELVELL